MKRCNIAFGAKLRFGASLNDIQLRLVRKGGGQFEGLVHERVRVSGSVGKLQNELIHITYQTLEEYFLKFNLFSSLDAREVIALGRRISWLKVFIAPIAHFFYFYFFKFSFLDGKAGFVYQK